ncbi:MAG TPA: hypothetical protein VGI10_18795 [Polyangiaceae bacterium]
MKKIPILVALCAALLLSLRARPARADASAWVFTGGGAAFLKQHSLSLNPGATMLLETGIGTSSSNNVIVGGSFQLQSFFSHGSDLALLARLATRGYVTGGFGMALDAGPYRRFWGETSTGGVANLFLGAPWGITLGASSNWGSNDARGISAVIGLDFARLTVFRNTGTNWLPNPFPADRPENH